MCAALVISYCMDFIYDNRFHIPQNCAAALGREQDVQRLRRRSFPSKQPLPESRSPSRLKMYFRMKLVGGAGCATCACADISCMCSPHVLRPPRQGGRALATVTPLASLASLQNLAGTSHSDKPSCCSVPNRRAAYRQSHTARSSSP